MAFDNLGFETEDSAALGYPDSWNISIVSGAFVQAAYDDGSASEAGLYPIETFEGAWNSNENFMFAYAVPLDISEVIGAFYDSEGIDEGVEDFEEYWNSNESFLFAWSSEDPAQYDTANELFEDFEEEWNSNESFDFTMGSTSAAEFDTANELFEDFEEEWNSNESFDFTMGSTSAAEYEDNSGGENFEDFEDALDPFEFIVDTSADTLIKPSHGLVATAVVTLSNVGGELPGGLLVNYEYIVVSPTTDNFKLVVRSGDPTVDITSDGIGTHTVTPVTYWSTMGTL